MSSGVPMTTTPSIERKRPGRRRLSAGSRSSGNGNGSNGGSTTTTLMEERKRNVLLQNVRLAQMDGAKKKQVFTGLESLMKSASESLIPSSSSKPTYTSQNNTSNTSAATNSKKRKHDQHQNNQHSNEQIVDVYASVVMTKEARAREQREKEEEEARVRRQRQASLEKIKQQRIEQRMARQALQNQWKAVETVASSMRHAYRLDQAERWLFDETEDDRQKKNTLDYLGLVEKGLPTNDHLANNLLTIDVIEI